MSVLPDDRVSPALIGVGSRLEGIAARTLGLMLALCLAGLAGLLTFEAVAASLGFVVAGGLIISRATVQVPSSGPVGATRGVGRREHPSGVATRPRPTRAETGRRTSASESSTYLPVTRDLAKARRALAPEAEDALRAFSQKVFADGALPARTKQLIAVAVAHVTQCPYCIKGHSKAARQHGATPEEIMEAVWVAAEMRAGAAWAHATLALAELGVGEPAEGEAGHG